MGCAGEPAALADATTAERAADLAAVAEAAADGAAASTSSAPRCRCPAAPPKRSTTSRSPRPRPRVETVAVHRRAFAARGLEAAFAGRSPSSSSPGVEFGNDSVAVYRPEAARALSAALARLPGFVFEAHSTDYQPPEALAALVRDGFAILKVGPGLTFALREALYGLDHIAAVLDGAAARRCRRRWSA